MRNSGIGRNMIRPYISSIHLYVLSSMLFAICERMGSIRIKARYTYRYQMARFIGC